MQKGSWFEECTLLLEEILKGLAGVVVARRRGRRRRNLGGLGVGSGSGIFFNGGAEFVELAVVLRVFWRDAFRDRLRTLKLCSGIEKAALLAGVQLELALGALTVGIEAGRQHRAAIGAARARHGADHAGRARPELIAARTALRRLAIVRFFFLLLLFRVAIPAVTVLSIHKRLRPAGSPDCNYTNSRFSADAHSTVACIRSDCYTRPLAQSFPWVSEQDWPSPSRRWDLYVCSPLGVRCQAGM